MIAKNRRVLTNTTQQLVCHQTAYRNKSKHHKLEGVDTFFFGEQSGSLCQRTEGENSTVQGRAEEMPPLTTSEKLGSNSSFLFWTLGRRLVVHLDAKERNQFRGTTAGAASIGKEFSLALVTRKPHAQNLSYACDVP